MKTLFERMSEVASQPDSLAVYVSGETLARLQRISAIDGRSTYDLALQAIENAATDDRRGDFLRSA